MDMYNINDFRKTVGLQLSTLIKYLPAIVPIDKNDEKILSIGLDMLVGLHDDLMNGDTTTLSEILDLEAISEEWPAISAKFMHSYSADLYDEQLRIERECMDYDTEE